MKFCKKYNSYTQKITLNNVITLNSQLKKTIFPTYNSSAIHSVVTTHPSL